MIDHQIVSSATTQLHCLHCSNIIEHQPDDELTSISCNSCNHAYPVIKGIPILLSDPLSYLSETALILKRHIDSCKANRHEIENDSKTNILRRNALKHLVRGIDLNVKLLEELIYELTPYMSVENLLERALQFSEQREYGFNLKDWRYLKRDWCWLPNCEDQLRIIKTTLSEMIEKHDHQPSNALVLGAGTGRIACDVASPFEKVYAFDRSFSMAYFFKKTVSEDTYFYELSPQNVKDSRNMTRMLKASLTAPVNENQVGPDLREAAAKVNYFVADAMHMPLPDASVSSIVSAYFTDVLALKLYLQELKRVLKPNGVFIHFGPFDYPFNSVAEKLGTNDIKTIFMQNGFEILEDRYVFCHHMETSISLIKYSYNNWVFVARKLEDPTTSKEVTLNDQAVISIRGKVEFVNAGYISNDGVNDSSKLILDNGMELEGAEAIISVLDYVDGVNTLGDIIQAMSEEFDMDEGTKQVLIEKIKELIDCRVLQVL